MFSTHKLHPQQHESSTYINNYQSEVPYLSSRMDSHDASRDLVTQTEGELRDQAHKICCEYLGGAWTKISPSDMSFTPISGGMSNQLFCCTLPDSAKPVNGEPFQALLRLYGDQSRNCDMTLQVQIFELLSSKELGPKLYGNFDDGRLEEFLPANSLTCEELMDRDISAIIAQKLAAVHSLQVPKLNSTSNNWILERFQEWLSYFNDQKKQPSQYFNGSIAEPALKIVKRLLSIDFEKEVNFLKQVFDGTRSPIVFSHNDLHQGNILLAKPSRRRSTLEKRVILIDFEYCSYNYRAYDIANHFCEWCFEYDTPDFPHYAIYSERFPSLEAQREFIRNYLDQKRRLLLNNGKIDDRQQGAENGITRPIAGGDHLKLTGNYLCDNNNRCTRSKSKDLANSNNNNVITVGNNNHSHGAVATGAAIPDEDDYEIDKIMNEVKPFCLAANLVWALWCIKSAHSSSIKFGYWEHAWTRWQFYSNLKRNYLKELEKGQSRRTANFIPKFNATTRTFLDVDMKR